MRTGAIREFDEETVVRYIKDVLGCEDRFQINFKAGVTIEMPWKKRTSSKQPHKVHIYHSLPHDDARAGVFL